jgi:hypothetical protein
MCAHIINHVLPLIRSPGDRGILQEVMLQLRARERAQRKKT